VVIAARGIAFVLAFAVPIVLVRSISKEDYGIYRQALFIYSTFMPILQFGLTQSLFYFFPRDPGRRPSLITQTLLLLAVIGFAFGGALIVARVWVAGYFGEREMAGYMVWVGPFTAFMVIASTLEILTIIEQRMRLTFWVIVGTEGLRAVLVVGAAVLTRDVGLMLAALAFFSLARVLFLVHHCRQERFLDRRALDPSYLREQLSYSIPFGLAATVVTVLSSVDRFYVSRVFDAEAFAVYSIGCFQLPVVTVVFTSATSVLLRRMAELQKEGRFADMLLLWRRSIRKMSLVSIPVVVAFAILAREFVVGLFTADYVEAVPIFIVFLALIPRQSIPYGVVTRAFGLTRYIMWVSLAALAVVVAFTLLLAPRLGLLGPAVAVILGMWIVAGAQIGRTRKLLSATWGRLLPWGDLVRMTVLAAGLGAVLAWARGQVEGPPIVVLGLGCLFYMTAFYALGFVLGIVERAELAEARNLLHRIGGQRR
jgi:O-antigen/teichoic acid export membrane protein